MKPTLEDPILQRGIRDLGRWRRDLRLEFGTPAGLTISSTRSGRRVARYRTPDVAHSCQPFPTISRLLQTDAPVQAEQSRSRTLVAAHAAACPQFGLTSSSLRGGDALQACVPIGAHIGLITGTISGSRWASWPSVGSAAFGSLEPRAFPTNHHHRDVAAREEGGYVYRLLVADRRYSATTTTSTVAGRVTR